MNRVRHLLCQAALLVCASWTAHAAQVPLPAPASIHTSLDDATRMTIPVTINGQGPFAFVIDTGADRTVISRDLARTLNLPAGPPVQLHDTAGTAQVQTVHLDTLDFGPRQASDIQAAVLERANLGAAGMLGIDSLRDLRVVLNFQTNTFSARPSRVEGDYIPANAIIVYGRRRFGQLVLVDAMADGARIYVILDTGAQNSLGNPALRNMLSGIASARAPRDEVISVTGRTIQADLNRIDEIRLGGLSLQHIPIAYAELDTFRQFGLENRPAMLLGMDVLRLFRSVSVDFLRHEASFVPK